MAYMNQEKKAKINQRLKAVIPKSWKWSLSVDNHSTIVLKIKSAPVDLIEEYTANRTPTASDPAVWTKPDHLSLNPYWWREHMKDGPAKDVLAKVMAALYEGNHDNSDIRSDYFDVGWYVNVYFGRWDKPFVVA